MARTRKIGIEADVPSSACQDKQCPFHGNLKLRGKVFEGLVLSTKMQKSAIVSWEGTKFVPKYERYKKKRTKVPVHAPSCLQVSEGDKVRIEFTSTSGFNNWSSIVFASREWRHSSCVNVWMIPAFLHVLLDGFCTTKRDTSHQRCLF